MSFFTSLIIIFVYDKIKVQQNKKNRGIVNCLVEADTENTSGTGAKVSIFLLLSLNLKFNCDFLVSWIRMQHSVSAANICSYKCMLS